MAKSTPPEVELRTTDNEAMGLGSKPPLSQLQPVMMYTLCWCIFDAFATNLRPSRALLGFLVTTQQASAQAQVFPSDCGNLPN